MNNYLLDTHTLLWYLFAKSELPEITKKIIDSSFCYYSYASFWEISIKQSLKKLDITHSVFEIDEQCKKAGFKQLALTLSDFDRVRNLPFNEEIKHNDPFDRLLISQAIENDLTIITKDAKIALYNVKTLW